MTPSTAPSPDITERKRAEEDKARLEAQLRHSQKMEAVGTLAGGIAHEFNNLLAAIMGYAELAQEDVQGPAQSAGKFGPDRGEQPAGQGSDRAIAHLQPQRSTRGQAPGDQQRDPRRTKDAPRGCSLARWSFQPTWPRTSKWSKPRPAHVNQLLVNLVSNAAHAMPDGGKLEISTANVNMQNIPCPTCGESMHGEYVLLKVNDSGHGMDQVTLRRILEPFFTTKEVGSGTGLGLSVVHGIIRSYRGHIICESQKGRGATFRIYLPAYFGVTSLPEPGEDDNGHPAQRG